MNWIKTEKIVSKIRANGGIKQARRANGNRISSRTGVRAKPNSGDHKLGKPKKAKTAKNEK